MAHAYPGLLMLLCLLTGCTTTGHRTPLLVTARQPVLSPVENGYVACATALYGSYQPYQLSLQPAYESGLVADGEYRLFRLSGWLRESGKRQQAHFECLTEPSRRARVLGLTRLSANPFFAD